MKWKKTKASRCRYSNIVEKIFGECEIIWEECENYWSGEVNILVDMSDNKFAFYSYSYGSCIGCDEWEARNLTDEQIKEEILHDTIWFDGSTQLLEFLKNRESALDAANKYIYK